MKKSPVYLCLLSFVLAWPVTRAFAADDAAKLPRNQRIDLIVVSEQSKTGADASQKSASSAPAVLLVDGGFIEAGDAIAGQTEPKADAVKSHIQDALQAANLSAVTDGSTASTIVVYTWGTLRPQYQPTVSGTHIAPNLKARLSLVAPWKTVADIEQEIVSHRVTNFSTGGFLTHPSWRDAMDFARDARYFVIFTAYPADATNAMQAVPLWRTTLSTQETSSSMDRAVYSLAGAAGKYLGKEMKSPENTYAALITSTPDAAKNSNAQVASGNSSQSDLVQQLVKRERDRASGEFGQKNDEKDVW